MGQPGDCHCPRSLLPACGQGLTSLAWGGEERPLPATMWANKLLPTGAPRSPEALEDRGACGVPAQFSSVAQLCLTLCDPMDFSMPGLPVHRQLPLLKLMSIESVMPSNHLILCHPLLLLSIFPSIRVFSNESVLRIRWPKNWSFSFSISPSKEYSGLISFRMDWLDLLAVQGTLKSLLQHHSSKASTLRRSAFFVVQLSHPYMTTGKLENP